jgi:hypothetical protein
LECPKRLLLITGCNLLAAFDFNFVKCLTLHTNKQQLITLSRNGTVKRLPATSRTCFVHAPLRQHGPRSSPLYSSDSEPSRGKTLVFPWLRQFSVPKLSCQMNFCKMMNFQLTLLSNIFPKPCMSLLLLCLGTILALTCPASCQPSCSPPPHLGLSGWRGSTLQLLYDGPYAVLCRGPRSFTIRVRSWDEMVAVSRLKACMAADATPGSPRRPGRPLGSRPGGLAATKWVSFSDPLVSSPSSSVPPQDRPGTVFLPGEEVFACLGQAAPSQPPQTRYMSRNRHRQRD